MNEINARLAGEVAPSASVRRSSASVQEAATKEASPAEEVRVVTEDAVASTAAGGKALPPEEGNDQPTMTVIAETVDLLTDRLQSLQRELKFSVDEASGRTVITVRDTETDEIVRQIPAEEAVRLAQRLEDNQADATKGLLLASQA